MEMTICQTCGGMLHALTPGARLCRCGQATERAKVCCQCGKDLSGHTRYHDHTGAYWCRSCREHEKRSAKSIRVFCEDCHKRIDGTKVDPYDGRTLCGACARERALDKSRPHRALYKQIYGRIERQQTFKMVCLYLLIAVTVVVIAFLRLI